MRSLRNQFRLLVYAMRGRVNETWIHDTSWCMDIVYPALLCLSDASVLRGFYFAADACGVCPRVAFD